MLFTTLKLIDVKVRANTKSTISFQWNWGMMVVFAIEKMKSALNKFCAFPNFAGTSQERHVLAKI
jgi:hypothetical protein